jgi:poly-gamma-glutamate capsule biosynthesis protein CapA/YwtB (metallophosphatase superfamily)
MVRLALGGDVMLGRGVDQILPHPGDPTLRERYVGDARDYVRLAERVNGPIPRPVDVAWPWGEALTTLLDPAPEVRVINLETSITRRDEFAERKAVHYRMDPDNLGALTVARPDVCTLANNHVLDFGRGGLDETLEVLSTAGLETAGAGRDAREARRPAVVTLGGAGRDGARGGRILVFAMGTRSSGIPSRWAATGDQSGVALLTEPLDDAAVEVLELLQSWKHADDLVVTRGASRMR